MGENINSNFLTAISTTLLVLVGIAQIFILSYQKKQTRIAFTEQYRQLWNSSKRCWGTIIFISRAAGEYYQALDEKSLFKLREEIKNQRLDTPTIWALESIQKVCGILGEMSTRVLQGHLMVEDVYPIFGTEFLRHSRALRQLLEPEYLRFQYTEETNDQHKAVRIEMQDWLIYHDGLRRRCLILIDLLWAEATRLEDLPPYDMKSAADAKKDTGRLNRERVFMETIKLNGFTSLFRALSLSRFLRRSEYNSGFFWSGIDKKKLNNLDHEWTKRLLRHENNEIRDLG